MQTELFEQLTLISPTLAPAFLTIATIYLSCYTIIWVIEKSGDEQLWSFPYSIFKATHRQLNDQFEKLTNKLLGIWAPPNLIIESLQPEKLVAESIATLSGYTDEFVDQMMQQQAPVLWDNLPRFIRNRFYNEAQTTLEPIIDHFFDQLQMGFSDLFKYPDFIKQQLGKATSLPVKLYCEGLIYYWKSVRETALLVSLPIVCLYTTSVFLGWLPLATMIPVMLMSATSLLTATLISSPHRLTNQAHTEKLSINQNNASLWLQQRQQINQFLSEEFAENILYFPHILNHLLESNNQQIKIRRMVRKSLFPLLEGLKLKVFTQLIAGPSALVSLKNHAVDKALEAVKIPFNSSQFINQQTSHMKQFLLTKANATPATDLFIFLQPLLNQVSRWILGMSLITGFFLSMLYTLIS